MLTTTIKPTIIWINILLGISLNICFAVDRQNNPKEIKPSLLIFKITPEKGVDPSLANVLTEVVTTEIDSFNKYSVISQDDLDKMLFWEWNKKLKNCTDNSCLAQIAGAFGAEYYFAGSIAIVGENYVLNFKIINVLKASVEKRSTNIVKKDESVLFETTKTIVQNLFGFKKPIEPVGPANKDSLIKEKERVETPLFHRVEIEQLNLKENPEDSTKWYRSIWFWSIVGITLASAGVLGYIYYNEDTNSSNYEFTFKLP